jgi:anti-sigma regulatory factor (Ser/Thr protein kinase)
MFTRKILPDSDNGVWVVSFSGELTPVSMIEIRTTVLKCLIECPAAIVVDLHELQGEPELSLALLPTLQRRARDAGVRLLYTAVEVLAERIRRDAARWFVEMYPTLAEAQAAAMQPGVHRWLRIELTPGPLRSAEARAQVGYVCTAWGLDHVAHRARMIVSELVENAVKHADTGIDVTVTALRDLLHVRVRDRSTRLPVRREPDRRGPEPQPPPGEGLRVVEQHATTWGVTPTDDGKIVWATIRTRPVVQKAPGRTRPIKAPRPTHLRSI